MAFINNLLGRNIRTLGLLLTITLLDLSVSHAQTFPVQANIHIAPPYSVYLSQYTSPEQEKVMVNILLRDPVITSLDVKFRFTIEGGGIKLTTNPAWNQQPFNLAGGIATTLSQDLIAEHLKPQNLLIEGVNPQEFFRSGKLPEGFYEFRVEVIEFRRGITISNIGRAGIWLTLNEAPRIVFPLAGQKVKATNPQMLNFTWIPGGASSPLSNLNTMYEFTLVELPDKSIDPTVAITTASNASKFVKTLDQTSLFYGPSEMPLTPGKTYAYRVKAYNTQGYELFKNGGYSEVRTFTFGDACNAPVSFFLQNPKQSSFEINVYTDPSNTAWKSRFREKNGTAGADLQSVPNNQSDWSELKAEDGTSLKSIMGLKPTTTYEVQVKGLCGDIASDYTQTQTITTKPMVDANRSCTNNPTPFAVDNVASLAQLKKNDIFFAALFPIKVIDVKSQGGGKFSGRGIATLPLFNTGLAVTFENVGINQLMQLTSGEVKVVRDELNITLFGDTPTPPGGGGTGGTGGSGGTTIVYPPINDTIVIPAVYDSLVVNNNTLIIYPPNGGAPITVDLGGNACTLLVPADGNLDNAKIVYDGAAQPYHPGQGNINNDDPKSFTGLIAHFKPDNSSLLGFDTLKYSVLANYYKQLTVAGKQRYLPWKAIKNGTPEMVNLRVKQGTDKMPFSSLKVKQMGMGDLTPSTGAGTQSQTYTLSGSYKGLEESVIAYYSADGKENYAGGLYIATYEQKKYKLFLVPLPGVNIPDDAKGRLTNELSTIYSQAVVSWNVDILKDFKGVDLGDNGLDWANKDMLSSYNTEMNSVISAFKDWKPNVDPDAYYLFIVPKFSEGNVEGFMPRNRRFGFVTQAQLDGRTIAHELGHGAFNLKHTFSPSDWNIQQSTTDNLMDYPSAAGQAGKKLWKPQWDFICNPEITTGLWDGMEEGAMITLNGLIDAIRSANLANSKSLPIVKDTCEKKAFGNFKVGEKTMTYIHLICGDLQKGDQFPYDAINTNTFNWRSALTVSSVYIDPSEISTEEVTGRKDGVKYIIYKFHELKYSKEPLVPAKLTDNVLFHIMVSKDESKDFEDYVFPTWEYLITKPILTPSEIAVVRKGIESLTDIEKKKELYLLLQEKVPYHNQRNNTSIATDEDVENNSKWLKDGGTIGDIMCNMTCFAACIEYLGKQAPCENCSEDCSNQMLFPDYLECMHREKIRPLGGDEYHRGNIKSRNLLGGYFNVGQIYVDKINDKNALKSFLKEKLGSGFSIIAAISGHFVRIQGIDENNITIDDPYGVLDIKKKLDGLGGYNCNTCEPKYDTRNGDVCKGNNNKWEIEEALKIIIWYELYYNK